MNKVLARTDLTTCIALCSYLHKLFSYANSSCLGGIVCFSIPATQWAGQLTLNTHAKVQVPLISVGLGLLNSAQDPTQYQINWCQKVRKECEAVLVCICAQLGGIFHDVPCAIAELHNGKKAFEEQGYW